jgi:superfamily II DNA/RNA helicase
MSEFAKLGISQWLITGLKALNISEPTAVQRRAIPQIFSVKSDGTTRRDVFACSHTGSGKTLAYVLPILELLVRDPRPYYALILAPTRELAYQINEMIKILAGTASSGGAMLVKSLLVIGGGQYGDGVVREEGRGLWFGKPNIVVATPGRLLDHLTNRNQIQFCGSLRTLSFDVLVLDEADHLISDSFSQQVTGILEWLDTNEMQHLNGETPFKQKKRQTLVFTATLTEALQQLSDVIAKRDPTNRPTVINLLPTPDRLTAELRTNPHLDQRYLLCPFNVKHAYLVECLMDLTFRQLIIFCKSKREARLVHRMLLNLGFSGKEFCFNPVLLNSDMKQSIRFASLDLFKALKSRILVTTDLANRGLDIPQVDLVINFSCPRQPINYVHRVGRTCRMPDFGEEEHVSHETSRLRPHAEQGPDSESDGSKTLPADSEKRSPPDQNQGYGNKVNRSKRHSRPIRGKSVTMVSQYDILLIRKIEEFIGIKLQKEDGLDEDNVVSILTQVGLAVKEAQLSLEFEASAASSGPRMQGEKRKKKVKV